VKRSRGMRAALLVAWLASSIASKIAPTLSYAGKDSIHSFLYGYDSLPKVLLLLEKPEGPTADGPKVDKPSEPPSWFTSVAVAFKDGRKKTASFAMVEGDDARKVAARLGIQGELPSSGLLIGCMLDGKSSGSFSIFDGYLGDGKGKVVREVRAFVQMLVDGTMERGSILPSFPPPDVPRKTNAISLLELTYETLPTHCFGGAKSLCVIALLPERDVQCPEEMKSLASRHRNDPVQFTWLKTKGQEEFMSAFGVESSQLPVLVVVRSGKRSRFALSEGGLDVPTNAEFIDNILGGGGSFKRITELPELTPPYLMESETKGEL